VTSFIEDGIELGSGGMLGADLIVPAAANFAFVVGYTNASWMLKAEPGNDVPRLPLLDLISGYVRRALAAFPAQGPPTPRPGSTRTHRPPGSSAPELPRRLATIA
jgi:hypothetical protein